MAWSICALVKYVLQRVKTTDKDYRRWPWRRVPKVVGLSSRVTGDNRELQDYLQRMAGYALTGVTTEQALFFLYGTGANGKSVFLNTISGLMGDYARTAPIETFIDSKNERHPTDLAGLQGARLITAVETEDGRRWAESKIKALTGGDRIAARFMRQDFFEFTPQFKLVIAGNHRPGLRPWMRHAEKIQLLPFRSRFPPQSETWNCRETARRMGRNSPVDD